LPKHEVQHANLVYLFLPCSLRDLAELAPGLINSKDFTNDIARPSDSEQKDLIQNENQKLNGRLQ